MGKALKFGTSGLRDTVVNMTDRECYINSRGFIDFLREKGELTGINPMIALGGDLRGSTTRIMAAVSKAVEDSGCGVVSCGRLPSPALAFFALKKGMPSIMVTGSHIPEDRNGIKFTKKSGEVLKSDEEHILKCVSKVRESFSKGILPEDIFSEKGAFKAQSEKPGDAAGKEALELYIKRYTDFFESDVLRGMKVVFYQHSAVGRDIVPRILEELGAEVIRVGRSEQFVPVDTEKISEGTRELLKKWAQEYAPYAVVSTDGDSDRPLVADENGTFIPGDKLGALVSLYIKPDFAAVPVSSNDAVLSALSDNGVKFTRTRIGSPYVIKAMMDEIAKGTGSRTVSWESNGGFLLGTELNIGGRRLEALPTRDAVLPVLALLIFARERSLSLSKINEKFLPARYTDAGVADTSTPGCENYTAEIGKKIVDMLTPCSGDIKEVDFKNGSIRFNRDVTEKCAQEEIEKVKNKLNEHFNSSSGFGEIESINFIDGIRVSFQGGDVLHLRPSGNAPEFRVYATADTPERASQMVSLKDRIIPSMMSGLNLSGARSVGAMVSPSFKIPNEILSAVKECMPFMIEPYEEHKVWGINGIGEYWYGPGTVEKSPHAVVDEQRAPMWALVEELAQNLIGEQVIEKFGVMAPLVKILTPLGRLSVQFHDSKNELWVVTSCDGSYSGGKNWIILGFSSQAVEKYGKEVPAYYGRALAGYAEALNDLIASVESIGEQGKELLVETRDVLVAAEKLEKNFPAVSPLRDSFISAREGVEFFYCYKYVKPGDVIPVPSGTLHALGPGVSVIEPQIAGPTQSLEDGSTYPVRYYFPGYQRSGALKRLDIERVGEMRPEVTRDVLPEVVISDKGYTIERLPGDFADKGLEARRILFKSASSIKVSGNMSMHTISATKGSVDLMCKGKKIPVPKAEPGGPMLIIPACLSDYEIISQDVAELIDTFTPI